MHGNIMLLRHHRPCRAACALGGLLTTAAAEMMAWSPACAGGAGSLLASSVLRLVLGEGTSTESVCQAGGRLARGLLGDLKGDGGVSSSAGAACCTASSRCWLELVEALHWLLLLLLCAASNANGPE